MNYRCFLEVPSDDCTIDCTLKMYFQSDTCVMNEVYYFQIVNIHKYSLTAIEDIDIIVYKINTE